DGVRGRQELPRRLATHDVVAARGLEVVRRVRLAAVKLADGERALEPLDVFAHVTLEAGLVEAVRLAHLGRDHALDLARRHRAASSRPGRHPGGGAAPSRSRPRAAPPPPRPPPPGPPPPHPPPPAPTRRDAHSAP